MASDKRKDFDNRLLDLLMFQIYIMCIIPKKFEKREKVLGRDFRELYTFLKV
jgi:hypothetical protein